MPVYNGAEFLDEALESVLVQTYADFEVVVVDDGSTDATPEILERYVARDRRFRVERQSNKGVVDALNHACQLAEGTYLSRLDSDDVALPGRLALQVEFLRQHPEVAVVGGGATMIDRSGRPLWDKSASLEHEEIVEALLEFCAFIHSTVSMRRDAVERVGGYRGAFKHAEDHDLWLRLSETSRLAQLPEIVARYRLHPGQVSVQELKRQALSSAAAKAAARVRRRTGVDPTYGLSEITPATCIALGLDDADLVREHVVTTMWYAKAMARAGYRRTSRRLWSDAAREARRHPDEALYVQVLGRRAESQREQGRSLRATALTVRAARRARRYSARGAEDSR
jgi:glycosyltransferase involved in cell wall biosynthesis